ncbi:hypothetical protein GGR54DRAFT_591627 [Hypoxylon sp. NC1633]|nr:hypothetical protein GGR54DRAFT_591627 [Hypoxylon sp. NC1633]
MASKRKFSDLNADSSEQTEKRKHIPGHHPPKKSKKSGKKNRTKPNNLNWIKKRVRTIERRFHTGQNLPSNVQHDLMRELAHHQQKIDEAADAKKRKSMIGKYHMVRFFERKKADRLAKQIESQLETATDAQEIKKLKADLHKAEVDSIYAKYFPFRERYISLYPVSSLGLGVLGGVKPEDASSAAQALHTERPPLWELIEKAAEEGTSALTEIRERKLNPNSNSKKTSVGPSKDHASAKAADTTASDSKGKRSKDPDSTSTQKGKGKAKQKELSSSSDESSDSESDSDGGFFEEG